jgi:hypothetical protein
MDHAARADGEQLEQRSRGAGRRQRSGLRVGDAWQHGERVLAQSRGHDAAATRGSIYYERTDHHLVARRPNGASAVGPVLADKPNGLGGGVQYLQEVAGGTVWVSEPAGQGLDATYTTYDAATLRQLGSFQGSVTSSVVDSTVGALALESSGSNPACPQAGPSTPTSCVFNITPQGSVSNAAGVGSAVTLIGPQPAVIASDNSTGQFDLFRLS